MISEYKQQIIDYTRNLGITVDCLWIEGTVTISDKEGFEIILAGQKADEFIDESQCLYDQFQDATIDDVYMLLAYPYCDKLQELYP